MSKNNSKRRGKRGRPERPLEIEVELIESEETAKRWVEIFRLLEVFETEQTESLTKKFRRYSSP